MIIQNASLESKGLVGLDPIGGLRHLDVSGNHLESFAECPRIESLNGLTCAKNPLSNVGLDSLVAAFPNLRYLDIEGTNVSDEGLKVLSALRELMTIRLRNTRVTGKGMSRLLDCPKLREIMINREQITDQVRAIFQTKQRTVLLDYEEPTPVPMLADPW